MPQRGIVSVAYIGVSILLGKVYEDHLGAALIQPGDSVIIRNEWFIETIRVEPREYALSSLFVEESG